MKSKVTDVKRKSDRIKMVILVLEKKILNVISAYAQQAVSEKRYKDV